MALAASVPHIIISWFRRRGGEFARPAARWLAQAALGCAAGVCLTVALTLADSGVKYRNEFPGDYSFLYGKKRPLLQPRSHLHQRRIRFPLAGRLGHLRFERLSYPDL